MITKKSVIKDLDTDWFIKKRVCCKTVFAKLYLRMLKYSQTQYKRSLNVRNHTIFFFLDWNRICVLLNGIGIICIVKTIWRFRCSVGLYISIADILTEWIDLFVKLLKGLKDKNWFISFYFINIKLIRKDSNQMDNVSVENELS